MMTHHETVRKTYCILFNIIIKYVFVLFLHGLGLCSQVGNKEQTIVNEELGSKKVKIPNPAVQREERLLNRQREKKGWKGK